jgi:hypothetical protein
MRAVRRRLAALAVGLTGAAVITVPLMRLHWWSILVLALGIVVARLLDPDPDRKD